VIRGNYKELDQMKNLNIKVSIQIRSSFYCMFSRMLTIFMISSKLIIISFWSYPISAAKEYVLFIPNWVSFEKVVVKKSCITSSAQSWVLFTNFDFEKKLELELPFEIQIDIWIFEIELPFEIQIDIWIFENI